MKPGDLRDALNLRDLYLAGNNNAFPVDIRIENERIAAVGPRAVGSTGPAGPAGVSISLAGAIVFPGLINSHDHLDFNLFPPLANSVYASYREWGRDIHDRNRSEIKQVIRIPRSLRTSWGLYKNLLNGVTTVVNHGDLLPIDPDAAGIGVWQEARSLHSVGFERNWKWKVNNPFAGRRPVAIHVGEGTDREAAQEIDRLLAWNLFRRPLIGVHGVAMDERQAAGFKALIWCIASNHFLLGRTADVHRLKHRLPILFGTDSTLTGDWNIWEHIRLARRSGLLTDSELLDSLTTTPASVWALPDTGSLLPGRYADLVVARSEHSKGMDALYSINPEAIMLILYRGSVRLFDASLSEDLRPVCPDQAGFSPVTIKHTRKYVRGDLPGLIKKIREIHPGARIPVDIG